MNKEREIMDELFKSLENMIVEFAMVMPLHISFKKAISDASHTLEKATKYYLELQRKERELKMPMANSVPAGDKEEGKPEATKHKFGRTDGYGGSTCLNCGEYEEKTNATKHLDDTNVIESKISADLQMDDTYFKSIDEDALEELYWQFGYDKKIGNLSERDVFKRKVRSFAVRNRREIIAAYEAAKKPLIADERLKGGNGDMRFALHEAFLKAEQTAEIAWFLGEIAMEALRPFKIDSEQYKAYESANKLPLAGVDLVEELNSLFTSVLHPNIVKTIIDRLKELGVL